jgi:L-alanine-DL-glutamate epimerase-like enolase superfamily enzyme
MDEVAAWLRHAADRASRRLATVCGFDLAVLDVAGQRMAQPLAAVLGGVRFEPLPAGVIIGFETPVEKLARYCASLRLAGKTHVKVKVGLPDDLERLAEVGRVFKALPLRLDANAAWSADEAVTRLRAMQDVVAIASIEQPVRADDLVGLRRIRQETGIAVMADESVCSLADAQRLAGAEAADIFNIRLGKNGGSLASARLVEAARDAQICVHLGTMVGETGILGRASEVFGRCVPGFTCLDGKGQSAFLLEVDIVEEFGDHSSDVEAPGLGVRVSAERLKTYTVGEPRRFS